MGLGIIEPKGLASTVDVQGSALLEANDMPEVAGAEAKRAKGKPDLILVPQPSDDPADPLNWSLFKKEACYGVLCFSSILAGVVGPLLAPAFVQLITDLNEPLSKVAWINVSLVLTIGFGSWLFGAFAMKFGHRPALLLALLTSFVSCLWAAATSNFNSLLGARAVQGLGMGALFNNPPAIIQDIFFVHERGLRLGIWNVCLIGGINIGPVISAQIIAAQGWHFAFWWISLAYGLALVAAILLVPETIYIRSPTKPAHVLGKSGSEEKGDELDEPFSSSQTHTVEVPHASVPSYAATLKPYTGTKTDTPLWRMLFRPLLHVTSPSAVLGCIIFSVSFNWFPLVSSTYAQIFTAPPFNFSTGGVGLISGIPPFIGTLIGTFAGGAFSDWFAKYAAKRNAGVFEPEFRLVLLIGFAVFAGIGSYGWGIAAEKQLGWPSIAVFIAILHVGVAMGNTGIIGYVSECAGAQAADAVGLIVLVKSIIGMGVVQIVNDWYASVGPKMFFVGMGTLTLAACALGIPFWIFGKKLRCWSTKHAYGRR